MTEAGREFQVVGAAQMNDRLSMEVRLSSNIVQSSTRVLMSRCLTSSL